jgi:3-dehydroquinate synthetase
MLPADSDLISDDIPLAAPGTPIEGRAERADAYPVVVTSDADAAHQSIADLAVGRRIMLITDDTVPGLHGNSLHRIGLRHSIAQLETEVDADAVIGALGKIRLIRDGSLRFVLPLDVGRVAIADDVTEDEVVRGLSAHVRMAAS